MIIKHAYILRGVNSQHALSPNVLELKTNQRAICIDPIT